MGQFSAELNYERRLERYEEEAEERILNSEDWGEGLKHFLEEAVKETEGQGEEPRAGASEEYGDSSLMMMEANLSEEEKREIEERVEEEHEVVTSDRLALLQKPEEEGVEELETEDHLRELIEGIEALAEGSLQRGEKPENLEEELGEEEKRQEELYREELFEAVAKEIEAEAESENPLQRLLEEPVESAEPKQIEKRIEKLPQKPVEYEKVEEYEEPVEELDNLVEKLEELMGGEEPVEEVVESLEEEVEEVSGEEELEEGVESAEEVVEERVEEVEELVEEETGGPVEELVEEVEEPIEKEGEELVEEVAEKEEEEELEGEWAGEEAVEKSREEGEEAEELVEEVGEETIGEVEREEEVEGEIEESVEEREEPLEGIRVKCVLKKHKENLRIHIRREQVEPYLGDEPCWIKIETKGKTFYKKYGPTFGFDFPNEIGKDGEEVEVTITRTTTYEFARKAIKKGRMPFDIEFSPERYWLIVGDGRIEISLKKDMYYDRWNKGPAIIFTIKDWRGEEHELKLVYNWKRKYLSKIMIEDFRRILDMSYDPIGILKIKYSKGKQVSEHLIYFENPKRVLTRMVEELKDVLSEGCEDTNLEGDIGEEYATLYLKEEIKKKISELIGIPEDELWISGPHEEGPDFHVYHKDEIVAIVEVKTTRISKKYPDGCLGRGKDQLEDYFTEEKWKGYNFRNAEFGISIAIYLRDLDEMIRTDCKGGIEYILGGIVWNPEPRS